MGFQYLCYGDVVQLQGNEEKDYLSAFGFTHVSCFAQELHSSELRGNASPRLLLFQILPKLAYDSAREMRRLQVSGSSLLRLKQTTNLTSYRPEERAEVNRLQSLSQSVEAEKLANSRLIESLMGSKVLYGQEIQLKHVASQAFLECAEGTARDQSCCPAVLTPTGSPEVQLRIESRHRYHSPGDPVLYDALILLKNVRTGLYLHCSEHPLPKFTGTEGTGFPPHPAEVTLIYEVNFSKVKTVWQTELFARAAVPPDTLRPGEIVRLTHINGALESDGSEVYVATRDRNKKTADGLFVLEKDEINWRLRHLLSNQILEMHSGVLKISQDGAALRFFSPSGRLCSSLNTGELVKLAGFDELRFLSIAERLEEKLPAAGRYFQPLAMSPIPKYRLNVSQAQDDTFLLQRADQNDMLDTEMLLTCRHSLLAYIAELRRAEETPSHDEAERVLGELVLFVIDADSKDPWTCAGQPHPSRQDLMQETGVISLVAGLLSHAFDSGLYQLEHVKQSEAVVRVCSLAYRLLTHAATDSRANERYCAQWLPLYLSHIQRSQEAAIGAEETLTEILSDNTKLLEEIVSPETVQQIVDLLRLRRDSKYVQLLTVLCTSQGEAVPRNQQTLSQKLEAELFLPLRLAGEAEVGVGGLWIPLAGFSDWSRLQDGGRSYSYLLSELELLAELTTNNSHASRFRLIFPFDVCSHCAEDVHLKPELRSRFVRIILSLHVDQGQAVLELPRTVRVVADLEHFSKPVIPAPAFIETVKRFAHGYLRELRGLLPAGEDESNGLTKEVLRLTLFLVNRGLCSDEEVTALVDALIQLLDGTLDETNSFRGLSQILDKSKGITVVEKDQRNGRFLATLDAELPTQCRLLVCQILSAVIQLRQDTKLTSFLRHFRFRDQPVAVPSRKKVADTTSSTHVVAGPESWVEQALQDTNLDLREDTGKDFLAVALDLLQYDHPALRSAVFTLLIKYYTQSQQLLTSLLRAQLLEDQRSAEAYQTLIAVLTQLPDQEESREDSGAVCQALAALATLGTGERQQLLAIVKKADDPLQAEPSVDQLLTLTIQGLLANREVHKLALGFALRKDCEIDIRRLSFVLLTQFCSGNPQHQELLSSHVEAMVEAIPTCTFALTAVREIYRNNMTLCINLPLRVLSAMCRVISLLPLTPKKCECLRQLTYFLQVQGQTVVMNQGRVLGQLLSLECRNLSQLLDQPDSLDQIQGLVSQFESDISSFSLISFPLKLQYLAEVLDVVALCGQQTKPAALFTLPRLRVLVRIAGQCWPLRRAALRCLVCTHDLGEELWTWVKDLQTIMPQTGRVSCFDGTVELSELEQRYVYEAVVLCLTKALQTFKQVFPSQWTAQAQVWVKHVQYLHNSAPTPLQIHTASCLLHAADISVLKNSVTSNITELKAQQYIPPQQVNELQKLVKQLMRSETVTGTVNREFDQLVQSYLGADRLTAAELGPAYAVPPSQLFRSLIAMLDIDDDVDVSDEVTEHGLRLLRRSVATAGPEGALVKWKWEDWKDFEQAVISRQMQLIELGAVRLICVLLSTSRNAGVRSQAVLLGIALLLGGNFKGQTALFEFLQQDSTNQLVSLMRQDLLSLFQQVRKEQQAGLVVEYTDSTVEGRWERYVVDAVHRQPFQRLVDILRFMQLACEGHCRKMQDHLREQVIKGELHGKSFNFVQAGAEMLSQYVQFVREDNATLGLQLLDLLVETIQGPCHGNQQVLAKPSTLETCRFLLLPLPFPPNSNEQSQLKAKTVTLLLSLLEGETDLDLSQEIAERLDAGICKQRMLEQFRSFVTSLGLQVRQGVLERVKRALKRDSFQGVLQEGFELFALLSKLEDLELLPNLRSFQSPEEEIAFQFFANHTARIEVVIDGLLQRTYFPVHPLCQHITEQSKDNLMLIVDRDSPTSKVTDLMRLAEALITEMDHSYWLANKWFVINADGLHFIRQVELVLIFAINGLMLFKYMYAVEDAQQLDSWCDWTVRGLGIALLVLAVWVLLLWLVLRAKLVIHQGWNNRSAPFRAELVLEDTKDISRSKETELLLTYGPCHPAFRKGFSSKSTALLYRLMSAKMVVSSAGFLYFAVYLAVTGLGQYHDFFYCLLLLDVVYMFETLHTLYSAITLNANQILWTLALLAVFNYFYGLWGYYIDPGMYYDSSIGSFGETLCQSLWECTLTTWNLGLRLTGGIGDILIKAEWDEKGRWYDKYFFEFTYFLLVIIIMLNVFLAIIVTTFAQLRDLKKSRLEDMESVCFMCGTSSEVLERDGNGFNSHIKKDHYLWHYLHFIVHLREKDPTEYTGVESAIAAQFARGDVAWMPLNKALCLRGLETAGTEALENKLKELEHALSTA